MNGAFTPTGASNASNLSPDGMLIDYNNIKSRLNRNSYQASIIVLEAAESPRLAPNEPEKFVFEDIFKSKNRVFPARYLPRVISRSRRKIKLNDWELLLRKLSERSSSYRLSDDAARFVKKDRKILKSLTNAIPELCDRFANPEIRIETLEDPEEDTKLLRVGIKTGIESSKKELERFYKEIFFKQASDTFKKVVLVALDKE